MTPSPDSSGRQDNDADCVDDDNLGVQPQNKFPATQFFILFAKKVIFFSGYQANRKLSNVQ